MLIAPREQRRNLRTGSRIPGSADEVSTCRLKAFKQRPINDPHIELPDEGGSTRDHRNEAGRSRRLWLLALLIIVVGTTAPFGWNYLQSYESTDDAEIDGHIDPLSSRIDGTVIAVHAEDDDRVKKGELLVEVDPRDYEVAVEQMGSIGTPNA